MGTTRIYRDGVLVYDEDAERAKEKAIENQRNKLICIHEKVYIRMNDLSESLNKSIFRKEFDYEGCSVKHRIHLLKSELHRLETELDRMEDMYEK